MSVHKDTYSHNNHTNNGDIMQGQDYQDNYTVFTSIIILADLAGLVIAMISLLFPIRKMEHDQRAPAVSPTLSSTALRPNIS